jgi:F0F1-type ATP synthase assembly protein I
VASAARFRGQNRFPESMRQSMRPFRVVLLWQSVATAALTLVAAVPWGMDGALSAALGGLVNVAAGAAYAWIVSRGKARSAGDVLRTMFRAEAAKILVIVLALWGAMAHYRSIVHGVFLGSFLVTLVIFAAAIAVRDGGQDKTAPANGPQ